MQISNNYPYNIYYPCGDSSRAENPKEQESPKTYGEILNEAIQQKKKAGKIPSRKMYPKSILLISILLYLRVKVFMVLLALAI